MSFFKSIIKISIGFLAKFLGEGLLDRIKDFFKRVAIEMMDAVVERLKMMVKEKIMGVAHAYQCENDEWLEKTKAYTVDPEIGEWNEYVVSKRRKKEDIPPKYRKCRDEINDTKELKEEMEMIYG